MGDAIPVVARRSAGFFVAECLELALVTQGSRPERSKRSAVKPSASPPNRTFVRTSMAANDGAPYHHQPLCRTFLGTSSEWHLFLRRSQRFICFLSDRRVAGVIRRASLSGWRRVPIGLSSGR